jgi:hypothetical protein
MIAVPRARHLCDSAAKRRIGASIRCKREIGDFIVWWMSPRYTALNTGEHYRPYAFYHLEFNKFASSCGVCTETQQDVAPRRSGGVFFLHMFHNEWQGLQYQEWPHQPHQIVQNESACVVGGHV